MSSNCQVTVKQGVLQGKVTTTVNGKRFYSFEGIPYAKPPVGDLRFRDPRPPENWSGIRDATKPGNRCAQIDPYRPSKFHGSEDCLYLNVYTPSLPAEKLEKLPVLFFIHGGRYVVGYADYYKPDFFIEQNCIVVSINYRLHILGFFSLENPEIPGNAGLKDIVYGLRWVRDNTSLFNGDVNNVTAFGESAGSGSVAALLASKMADGLFHKCITESGSCLADLFMVKEVLIDKAQFFVSHLGETAETPEEMLKILRKASIEDLVRIVGLAELSREEVNAFFLPIVEKRFDGVEPFFLEDPWVTFREDRIIKVPTITGLCSHEGAYFLQKGPDGKIEYKQDIEFFIPRYLHLKPGSKEKRKFAEILKRFYFKGKEINDETRGEYLDFVSDAYFARDLTITTDYFSKTNKEVYFYRFAYEGNLNTRVMNNLGLHGATHGDILAYQFYRKNKMDQCTESDLKVIKFLSEAWCNFARTGKPTWSGQDCEWLPYNKNGRNCLDIAQEIKYTPYPYNDRIDLWRHLMFDKCKL